jgi:hypothetical protein
MAKSTRKTRSSRSRDRKLVAGRQKHEVRYIARKAGVKGKAVKKAVKRVGHGRKKIEQVLKSVKKVVKRVARAPKKVVKALRLTPESSPPESASPKTKRPIREHMEVIGADGVHIGTVDKLEGDRIKLTKKDSGQGSHQGHHHYIPTALVAEVEGDQVRLSANADVAITFVDEADGGSSGRTKIS